MKVFAPLTTQWEYMMDVIIVLTITIGNLFAMRQSELKRFMAFSSISQAGYIMLAVIGNSSMGVASLMFILMHAFAPLIEYWEYLLYIVIVLSITIANLFAIRQSELKRFMAFSSISQAGYIMLAVIGGSQMGMASLMYYVLVYVVANMAVFTVISTVEQNNGGTTQM